jgi:hypothetical protein
MKKIFFCSMLLLTAVTYAQTITDCSQIVPNGEDIYNGTFLGGPAHKRAAADISVDTNISMNISQVKVCLAGLDPITYVDLKFYKDNNGVPGESYLETYETTIIADDTLGFVDVQVGHLRKFTLQPATPVVLAGEDSSRFWMEVISDARAWGVSPNPEDTIGLPLGIAGDDTEWYTVDTLDALYEITAQCTADIAGLPDQENGQFGFYPNPVSDVLTIEFQSPVTTIKAINMLGQQIGTLHPTNGQIDVSSLPNGVYMIQAQFDNGLSKIFRIIKN